MPGHADSGNISSARSQSPSSRARGRHNRRRSTRTGHAISAVDRRLLETFGRAGVWPDSVQALGGTLSMRLPTSSTGVALFRTAARRVP